MPSRGIVASTRIATPCRCVASGGVATRHGFVAVLHRVVATTRGVAPCVSQRVAPRHLGVRSFVSCSVAAPSRADSFRHCAISLHRFWRGFVALAPCSAARRVDATPRRDAAVSRFCDTCGTDATPVASMRHICDACGTYVTAAAPLRHMRHICDTCAIYATPAATMRRPAASTQHL